MKLGQRKLGSARLTLAHSKSLPPPLNQVVELSALTTEPARRKGGHANRLMNAVCAEADKSRSVLLLMPDGAKWLQDWYESHGFKTIQTEPVVLMARAPN